MHLKPDPMGEPRNPLAIYLLGLAVLSGFITAFGPSASDAVGRAVSESMQRLWGVLLVLGPGATLVGIYWQGQIRDGLLIKRWGMLATALAAAMFSGVVLGTLGVGGILTGGIIAGFGVACVWQWRRIEKRVRAIKELSEEDPP